MAVAVADKAHPRQVTSGVPALRAEPFWADGAPGSWVVHWRIHNERARPVQIDTAVQPHTQFRTPETKLGRDLSAHGVIDIDLPVRFNEEPGTVVENPFLILRATYEGVSWRILLRVQVTAGIRGEPIASRTLSVSTDRVGAV